MTTARVTYHDSFNSEEHIQVDDHEIQFGGSNGDGYCYGHNSFECLNNLTPDQHAAIQEAE